MVTARELSERIRGVIGSDYPLYFSGSAMPRIGAQVPYGRGIRGGIGL